MELFFILENRQKATGFLLIKILIQTKVTTALLFGLPLICTSRAEAVSNVTCLFVNLYSKASKWC